MTGSPTRGVNRSYETTRFANAHHAAAVRMARFDRQPAAVRDILNYGLVKARIPARPLTLKQAHALANGSRRA